MKNLRDILNGVLAQSAHIKKANFANSSDVDDQQMVAIANRVLWEFRDFYPWNILRKPFTVTMLSSITRYPMPSDFLTMVPDSGWQEESTRKIDLPVPDGRWYRYLNSNISSGGTVRCRFLGNEIEIADPQDGQLMTFEYITNLVVKDSTGLLKMEFTSDTDEPILDDQVLSLGIQAHWAHTKLLPQTEQWRANYLSKLGSLIGKSRGAQTVGGSHRSASRSPYTPLYVR